jgi:archaellum component FlaC
MSEGDYICSFLTTLSERLANIEKQLEFNKGEFAKYEHQIDDIWEKLNGLEWDLSNKYSMKTVPVELVPNKPVKLYLD